MPRTQPVAPQFKADAAEVAQDHDINLNPGQRGQELAEEVPTYTPEDVETAAFFEQRLTVQVHERADLDMPGIVLNFNGEDAVIPFGQPVRLKRKFVQHLLDMRETTFKQPKANPFQVETGNVLIPKTVLLYPFSVSHDPHPRGGEWLRREQMKAMNIGSGLR